MPTYKITDPNTGRTLRLTGDRPPTEQELSSVFQSTQTSKPQEGFLSQLGKAMVEPVAKYGSMVGEGLAQSGRLLTDPKYREIVQKTNAGIRLSPEESQNVLGRKETYLMKPESMKEFDTLGGGLMEGAKRTAGMEAYLVPAGAGGGAAFRAAHPVASAALRGGVIGGLGGFSRSEKGGEVGGTLAGAGFGSLLGAGMAYGGQKLKEPVQQLTQKAKQTLQEKVAAPVSKTAARVYSNIFQISKRKATRDLDPLKTSQELMDLPRYVDKNGNMVGEGFYPKDWDDFVARSNEAAKVLTDMTDDAAKLNGQPIDVSSVSKIAREKMANKIGFDPATQDQVIRQIGLATPNSMEGTGLLQNLSKPTQVGMTPYTTAIGFGSAPINTLPNQTAANINNISASQALQLERQLQEQAAAYGRAYAQSKAPDQKVMKNVFNAAAQEMKKVLDSSFKQGQQQAIEQVKTPERIAALNNAIPGLGDKIANKVGSLSQLRATNAPLVQGLILSRETEDQLSRIFQQTGTRMASRLVGGMVGGGQFGLPGMIGGMTVGPAVTEPFMQFARDRAYVPAMGLGSKIIQGASSGGLGAGMQQGTANVLQSLSGGLQNPLMQKGAVTGGQALWDVLSGRTNGR